MTWMPNNKGEGSASLHIIFNLYSPCSWHGTTLPIGSGEVESAHRYVIQKRLKLPGAWWRKDNAQAMLNLRVARANHRRDHYWNAKAA